MLLLASRGWRSTELTYWQGLDCTCMYTDCRVHPHTYCSTPLLRALACTAKSHMAAFLFDFIKFLFSALSFPTSVKPACAAFCCQWAFYDMQCATLVLVRAERNRNTDSAICLLAPSSYSVHAAALARCAQGSAASQKSSPCRENWVARACAHNGAAVMAVHLLDGYLRHWYHGHDALHRYQIYRALSADFRPHWRAGHEGLHVTSVPLCGVDPSSPKPTLRHCTNLCHHEY